MKLPSLRQSILLAIVVVPGLAIGSYLIPALIFAGLHAFGGS